MAPQHAVEVEDRAEHDEGERLGRRVRRDELRHEREEEQRHLRVQRVGEEALQEDRRRGLAGGGGAASTRTAAPTPARSMPTPIHTR